MRKIKSRRKKTKKNEKNQIFTREIVPSPKWLQRRMYRNLLKNSYSIINKNGTKIAQQLLADIDKAAKQAQQVTDKIGTKETEFNHVTSPVAVSQKPKTSVCRQAITAFKRHIGQTSSIIRRNLHFRTAHSA